LTRCDSFSFGICDIYPCHFPTIWANNLLCIHHASPFSFLASMILPMIALKNSRPMVCSMILMHTVVRTQQTVVYRCRFRGRIGRIALNV
jgi:hypothetical protein